MFKSKSISKMKLFVLNFSVILFILSISPKVFSNEIQEYQIKPQDTLSQILVDHFIGPLYGKNGYIKKAIELNKSKIKADGSIDLVNCPVNECKILLPAIPKPYYQANQLQSNLTNQEKDIISSEDGEENYKVLKGDVLSMILYYKKLRPIYGERGYVSKTIQLNKEKIHESGKFNNRTCVAGECWIKIPYREIVERKVANIVLEKESQDVATSEVVVEKYPYTQFNFSPTVSFLKVNSDETSKLGGSEAILLSKDGFAGNIQWKVFYSENLTFHGFAEMDYHVFYADPEHTFNHRDISRLSFGVGGSYKFSNDYSIVFNSKVRQMFFLNVQTRTTVNVELMTTPEVEVGVDKVFLKKNNLNLKWGLSAIGIFPESQSSFKSQVGLGGSAKIQVEHLTKALFLQYDYRSLKINSSTNTESSLLLGMNFGGQ